MSINSSEDQISKVNLNLLATGMTNLINNKLMDNVSIFNMQHILETCLHPENKDERLFDFSQKLKSKLFDLNDEFHELLDELPHKPWKKDKCLAINDDEYLEINGYNILMELSDTTFFYHTMMNMVINKIRPLMNIDVSNEQFIRALYVIKYYNNTKRIFDGDFELKRKLTEHEQKDIDMLKELFEESFKGVYND